MKHNPFKKTLALLLLSAMTAAVGCKDYDDDIDTLNARLDDMQGKIELKADASALTALSAKVDAIDLSQFLTSDQVTSRINSALAGYLKSSDLKAEADKLGYQLADDVQAAIDAALAGISVPSDEYIKGLIDTQLALADLWTSDLQSKVAALIAEEFKKHENLTQTQTNQAVAAVLAALNDDKDVAGIREAISKLVGEDFSTYMADYIKTNAATWNGQVSDAVAAQLNANNQELKDAIIKAVSGSYLTTADVQKMFEQYDAQLRAIVGDVEALKSRIQSLVNVPEYMDGTSSMNPYKVGGTELDNCAAVLTYRVAPAALNEEIVALWENRDANGAEFSMISEEVTRAAGAGVTITGMKALEDGKFEVSVIADQTEMEALAARNKTLALALAINFRVAPAAEEGSEEPVSEVENDITSDFAGIRYDAVAKSVEFKFYKDGEAYAPQTYEKPFNTSVADSKKTLLEGTEIRAALKDGAFRSLAEINTLLDADIKAGKYTVEPTYTDPNGTAVTGADVNSFIIKATTNSRAYDSKLATVEFRTTAKPADVYSKAEFAHTVTMNVGGAATAEEVTIKDTYTIVREQGATFTFGEQTIPWTYNFVKAGYPNTTTPQFDETKLGEIRISHDDTTPQLPDDVKIEQAFSTLDRVTINDASVKLADKPFTFTPFVSTLTQGIKIAGEADAYAWGQSYEVEYTYVHENIEYKLVGTLNFGAAPADVTYTIAGSTIAYYEDMKNTGSWPDLYKAFGQTEGYTAEMFGSADDFKAAVLKDAPAQTTATTRNPETEAADVTANGSVTVDNGKIEGALGKAAIAADGDQFVQESSFTTWYGQKITVKTAYAVDFAAYGLKTNDKVYVSNNVVTLRGALNASGIWAWEAANLPEYFLYTQPQGKPAVEYVFKKVSEDDPVNNEFYATIGTGDKLDWTGQVNQKSVKIECSLQFQGTNVQTADKPITITVQLEEPITELKQASAITVQRDYENGNEIDLLTNLQLVDAEGTQWITFDEVSQAWLPTKTDNGNTAKEVFNATTGSVQTAGVKFEIVDQEDSNVKLLLPDGSNILTVKWNSGVFVQDQVIKVKATFTYQYGEKTAELTVIVKK